MNQLLLNRVYELAEPYGALDAELTSSNVVRVEFSRFKTNPEDLNLLNRALVGRAVDDGLVKGEDLIPYYPCCNNIFNHIATGVPIEVGTGLTLVNGDTSGQFFLDVSWAQPA